MTDATSLGEAIAAGHVSAAAVMAASYEAVEARRDLGAVARLAPRPDPHADVPQTRTARPPFHAVPFLAKDLGSAASGLAPAAGAPALRRRLSDPDEDSVFIGRLRSGGVVPIGLSTVPEFGFALSAEPPGGPPARNPFDLSRTPGGSSGGAAAAVAGGIVALAHATDAAGSIRVPAACCGLWGLKASRGALPQGPGYHNLLMGLAGDGVVARSLRDVAHVHALASGQALGPAADIEPVSLPPVPRIGLALPERCSPADRAAARQVADLLATAGCNVIEGTAPDTLGADCHRLAGRILCVSQADWLGSLGIAQDEVSPLIAACVERGRAMTGPDVYADAREVAQLSHSGWALFNDCDALVMPILSGPPPPIGHFDFDATDIDAHLQRMEAMAPNAAIANVCGGPALAIPTGLCAGMPVGVQLIGPMGADEALLALAARIETQLMPVPYPAPLAGLPQ